MEREDDGAGDVYHASQNLVIYVEYGIESLKETAASVREQISAFLANIDEYYQSMGI